MMAFVTRHYDDSRAAQVSILHCGPLVGARVQKHFDSSTISDTCWGPDEDSFFAVISTNMASSIVKFDTQTLEWTTIYDCPLLLTDLAVSHTGTHFAFVVGVFPGMDFAASAIEHQRRSQSGNDFSRFDKGPVRSGGSFSDGTVKYGYVLSRQNNKITQIPPSDSLGIVSRLLCLSLLFSMSISIPSFSQRVHIDSRFLWMETHSHMLQVQTPLRGGQQNQSSTCTPYRMGKHREPERPPVLWKFHHALILLERIGLLSSRQRSRIIVLTSGT
ncbi:hypothetical protein BLNAU_23711 [Blattamonas nauphoetae]|uniref:Uncharacterized protein n=1 Tax=Blattamonas nauphoetae TaxID=2049346 RepID=A0ABQ9WPX7_9EUKA|nr:hypothetical protein BLNAU_23711 [Blattamonas nauphoetae]